MLVPRSQASRPGQWVKEGMRDPGSEAPGEEEGQALSLGLGNRSMVGS